MNMKKMKSLLLFIFVIFCIGINACENFLKDFKSKGLLLDEALLKNDFAAADRFFSELEQLENRCGGVSKLRLNHREICTTVYSNGFNAGLRCVERKLHIKLKDNDK